MNMPLCHSRFDWFLAPAEAHFCPHIACPRPTIERQHKTRNLDKTYPKRLTGGYSESDGCEWLTGLHIHTVHYYNSKTIKVVRQLKRTVRPNIVRQIEIVRQHILYTQCHVWQPRFRSTMQYSPIDGQISNSVRQVWQKRSRVARKRDAGVLGPLLL